MTGQLAAQLRQDAVAFASSRDTQRATDTVRRVLWLVLGVDVEDAASLPTHELVALEGRLRRLVRRERMKGQHRHWSYDLNRRLALKDTVDAVSKLVAERSAHCGCRRQEKAPGSKKEIPLVAGRDFSVGT